LGEPKTAGQSLHDFKIAQGGAVGRLRVLQDEISGLVAQRKAAPKKVRVADAGTTKEVMRLEAKAIVDRVKISAYNAEEWLLDRLVMHYQNPHDVRDLLPSFAELSGQIETTDSGVLVTLDPPDTPIQRRALAGLIEISTAWRHLPGHRRCDHLPGRAAPFRGHHVTPDVQMSEFMSLVL
jgi:hypothetical protein